MVKIGATIAVCALIVFFSIGSCWLVYEKGKRKERKERNGKK